MALQLILRQGHDFYVEDQRLQVSKVFSAEEFTVRLPDGSVVDVTSNGWVTVLGCVKLQAGIPKNLSYRGIVRLLIDAPRTLKILRGDLYQEEKDDPVKAQERIQRRQAHGTE